MTLHRWRRQLAVLLLVATLGTSCAPARVTRPADLPASVIGANHVDARIMLGAWRVVSPPSGATIVFEGSVRVELDCGDLHASWKAHPEGPVVMGVQGRDMGCTEDDVAGTAAWLGATSTARIQGGELLLLDSDEDLLVRLARLNVGIVDLGEPSWVRDEVDPLIDSLRPADGKVVGTWYPTANPVARSTPYLELDPDGRWVGFDGCNETRGRWQLGPGGAIAAAGGIQTLIGCVGFPVASSMTSATRAGIDHDELVLFDADGAEIARFEGDPGP